MERDICTIISMEGNCYSKLVFNGTGCTVAYMYSILVKCNNGR